MSPTRGGTYTLEPRDRSWAEVSPSVVATLFDAERRQASKCIYINPAKTTSLWEYESDEGDARVYVEWDERGGPTETIAVARIEADDWAKLPIGFRLLLKSLADLRLDALSDTGSSRPLREVLGDASPIT